MFFPSARKRWSFIAVIVLAFVASSVVFSAGNPIISGISVEGNTVVDAATIVSISGLRVGQELNPRSDDIPQGIKALWARKQFSDVRIVVDRVTPLGLFLKIEVKENPRFDRVIIQGNLKISEKSLLDSVKKSRGDLLPYADAQAIGRSLRQLYHKEGLLFASVVVDTGSSETPGYVTVVVRIEEGKEYKVGSLTFIGNATISGEVLSSQVEDSDPSAWWQFWKSAKFDTMKLNEDVKRVEAYYKNNGFLNAVVRAQDYKLDEKEGKAHITMSVQEGTKYYVRNVSFEGSTVYNPEYLKQRLDIKSGSPVNAERIEKNLSGNEEQSDIRSLYLDNGFLQAQVQHTFDYVANDSVDVKVQVFERDQFTIRRVDVVGNTKTQDRVVRRELFTYPGEYFNRASIIRSIKGLGVLNYFNPEKLRPDVRPVSQNTVDLVYNVEERSTDMLNASVGYAGTFGLTGSVGVTFNNFDLSDPLRGGAGQVFTFQWDFGTANRLQTFSLGFAEPWLFGKPTSLGFNIFDTRTFFNVSARRTGAQLNIGRRFRFPDDFFRGDWSLLVQRQEQYGTTLANQSVVFSDVQLTQSITRTSFDNLIFPSSGSRFRYLSRFGYVFMNPANSIYWKNELQFEFVNPLLQIDGFNRLVLYLNSELGNVTNLLSASSFVPLIEYYSMGGNGLAGINVIPLRGYTDNSLAVFNQFGQQASRLIFRQTAELRFAISMNPMPIYASMFAEAGNAWRSFSGADLFTLRRSAGVGMRILLNPIGLIGFDYAYGFDPAPGDTKPSGWQFHFQFGR